MRFLFITLFFAISACTNPVDENYRQLDVSIQTSLDHKEDQIVELLEESGSSEKIDEVISSHKELENEFSTIKQEFFEKEDPRVHDLDEAGKISEKISLPDSDIDELRNSIFDFSQEVNAVTGDNVCDLLKMSTFHADTFPKYFQDQPAPSVLIFLRKLQLDCLQCKYLAIKSLEK